MGAQTNTIENHLGQFSNTNGFLGYNEICLDLKSWTYNWDDQQKVPYLTKRSTWVSYDDAASIRLKAKFAMSQRMAGIMVWSLDTDDFAGKCGAQKYPLLRSIHLALAEPIAPGKVNSFLIS